MVLGKALSGDSICLPLSKAPHVLVGGQSCSGKTTVLKNMILSLICSHNPAEVKLLLIDSEKQAFGIFEDTQYLLEPIVYHSQAAIKSLNQLMEECVRHKKAVGYQRDSQLLFVIIDVCFYRS